MFVQVPWSSETPAATESVVESTSSATEEPGSSTVSGVDTSGNSETAPGLCLRSEILDDPELVELGTEILSAEIAFTDVERERFSIDEVTEDFFLWVSPMLYAIFIPYLIFLLSSKILDRNQNTRPTPEEIERHPFFDNLYVHRVSSRHDDILTWILSPQRLGKVLTF